MSTSSRLRAGVALGALLISITPARADAQFGGLAKKMKEKIAQAGVERIVRPDSATPAAKTPAAAPAAPAAPATTATAASPATAAAPARTYVDAGVLEITPALVDGLLKGIAAANAQAQRRARPATITPDKPTDPFMAYAACIQKYDTDAAQEKACGTTAAAMAKQQEMQTARRAADARADSLKYGSSRDVTPDSVGALVMGVNQRQFGILSERATAFLVLAAGDARAACMRTQKEQYRFTDAESAALAARRAELSKIFLDADLVRRAMYGSCRSTVTRVHKAS